MYLQKVDPNLGMFSNEMLDHRPPVHRLEPAVVALVRPAVARYPAVKLLLVNAHSGAVLGMKSEMDSVFSSMNLVQMQGGASAQIANLG